MSVNHMELSRRGLIGRSFLGGVAFGGAGAIGAGRAYGQTEQAALPVALGKPGQGSGGISVFDFLSPDDQAEILLKGPVKDLTSQVQAALNAAGQNDCPLDVPAMFLVGSLNLPDANVVIRGRGMHTGFVATSAVTGTFLSFTASQITHGVEISDLRILSRSAAPGAVALHMEWPESFAFPMRIRALINNVNITGENPSQNGWAHHLRFRNCQYGIVRDCALVGVGDHDAPTTKVTLQRSVSRSETLIAWDGDYYPTVLEVVNSLCGYAMTGVQIGGSAEGIGLTGNTMISVWNGLTWSANPVGRPDLTMMNNHIAAWQSAVALQGIQSIDIGSSNLFYRNDGAEASADVVSLDDCHFGTISPQIWSFDQSHPGTAIRVGKGSTWLTIGGYINSPREKVWDKGIRIDESTWRIVLSNELRCVGPFVTTPIDNAGTDTSFGGTLGTTRFNKKHRAVTSAKATPLEWPDADWVTDQWWTAEDPSVFHVPEVAAGQLLQITCQVVWPSNPSGVREISIARNGELEYPGAGTHRVPASADGETTLIAQTALIRARPGDAFTVSVEQTSGDDLVPAPARSWICVQTR